ncbi:hypothetical protein Tco_1226027 [Tanacetum coccineum]
MTGLVDSGPAQQISDRDWLEASVLPRRCGVLQLGVKSYQKKLNLTRPDTYKSDLKRLPTYSAYPNPRGFIYQNKDKKNKLMLIDELHKFSDGTLNDVRTALDDNLKRIRIKHRDSNPMIQPDLEDYPVDIPLVSVEFLRHGYAVSSLMDTVYWSSE